MTRTELIALLADLGVRPSEKLGQNFLIDEQLLDAMVRQAAPINGERILEIGPGTGVLTERLLEAGCRVTAVEYDRRLTEFLRCRFPDPAQFRLIEGDACRIDYTELMGHEPFRCIANLPYACSSPLLVAFAHLRNAPSEMYVLLQKEVVDRLTSGPGTKTFGPLTVCLQLTFEIALLRKIPPEVFFPPPDIASAFTRLRLRADRGSAGERQAAERVARVGFSQRRKRLMKLLGSEFGQARVRHAFDTLDLSVDCRAEQLGTGQFRALGQLLLDGCD